MSIKIPQYNQQVSQSNQGDTYLQGANNPDAFGASLSQATAKLSESAANFAKGMSDIYENILNSNVLELSNFIDELDRTELSDPNNGYYSKLGKDAMRNPDDPSSGSMGVLLSIDDKIKQKQKELGLTWGRGKQMAELVKTRKMNTMYKSVTNHEFKQTQANAAVQNEIAINEAINKGMQYRNVEETRKIALNNGRAAVINNARMQHFDDATLKMQLSKFESDFHSAVVQSFLNDNSLESNEYFEKNKDKIIPETQMKLQNSLKNNELKYISKSIANDLFTMFSEDETSAISELDKKNLTPDEYDAVLHKINALYSQKYKFKEQEQIKAKNLFYDNAAKKIQNGEKLTLDDIPETLNGKNYIDARKALESLNQFGDIVTDEETKTSLEYISFIV